ncbi:MAG: TolC family protein [Planctomycetota bacterium]|nr:TolC family protein [Planctomycetota bacterium]
MKVSLIALIALVLTTQHSVAQHQLQVDLSLQDAIQLTQKHGSAVAQAKIQTLISEGAITSANGDFDTVFFADLNYNFNESPASGFFSQFGNTRSQSYSASQGLRTKLRSGGSLEFKMNEGYDDVNYLDDSQSNTSASVSFTQPLLRGAFSNTVEAEMRKAQLRHSSNLLAVSQASVDAVQLVVDAYWGLAFAVADLEVKKQSLQLAENLRDITVVKFNVGAVAEVEVTQTKADIASRKDAVLIAQNSVRTSHDTLRSLISAFDTQDDWQISFNLVSQLPEVTVVEVDWLSVWNTALENRADLKQLQSDIDSAQIDYEVASSNMLPKLDLSASGTYSAQDQQVSSSLDRLFDRDFPGYTVGFSFELPLSNNLYQGALVQAKQQLALAKRVLRDRSNELAKEVREALENVNYLAERVAVTANATQMAEVKLSSEQLRLSEGASTNYQVLQFQADLAVAQSQQLQAQTEYAKAIVKLETVQGIIPTL